MTNLLGLYPFQKKGVEFLTSQHAALLADEPGLGKTIQAICACNELKAKKILVVCPAIVKLNWEREIKIWLKEKLTVQALNGRKDVPRPGVNIIVVNYDLLISPSIFKSLLATRFAVGVFDESHYLKNRKAKRTKAVLLKDAIASRCVYKWFLTGTPILNRPVELYPVLKAVASNTIEPYTSYEQFAYRYCDGYFDGFQLIARGASNMDELCTRLSKNFMLRRLKKDHLKELPDKQYQLILLPPAGSDVKALVKKEFTFAKGEVRRAAVGGDGAELAVLRHILAISKVDACIEHIKGVLDETDKIVVYAYHTDVIARLSEALKEFGAVVIQGATTGPRRQANIDLFQENPKCRVFIGQIQAAGVGITLTAASTVIFVESSWVPGEVDQAVDRCHRIGQKDSVRVQFLVIQGSLEESMLRAIVDKKQTIAQIVDQNPEVAEMFL